jgi:hypothetical protein
VLKGFNVFLASCVGIVLVLKFLSGESNVKKDDIGGLEKLVVQLGV